MGLSLPTVNQTVPNSIFHLAKRNAQATEIIRAYALKHTLTDLGIGFVGTALPVPGSGIAAMVAAMLVQAPLFYQPMVRQLATVYAAVPDILPGRLIVRETSMDVMGELATEFGAAFLRKTTLRILRERNISLGVGFLPVVGGVASAVIDATFATTLTWRVGKMAAIYYQHGGWIHSREATYDRARALTPWSLQQNSNLAEIPAKIPEVQQKQTQWTLDIARELRQYEPESNTAQLRALLQEQGLPVQAIEEALQQL